MYRIINAGENRVLDHITISRETLKRLEAEKKEKERRKRQSPKETSGHMSPEGSLGQVADKPSRNFRDSPKETSGNNVYDSVDAFSNEKEEDLMRLLLMLLTATHLPMMVTKPTSPSRSPRATRKQKR